VHPSDRAVLEDVCKTCAPRAEFRATSDQLKFRRMQIELRRRGDVTIGVLIEAVSAVDSTWPKIAVTDHSGPDRHVYAVGGAVTGDGEFFLSALVPGPNLRLARAEAVRASVLPGVLAGDGVEIGAVRWPAARSPEAEGMAAGEAVDLVVRPESLAFVDAGDGRAMRGRVVERRYAGAVTYYQVALDGGGELEVLSPSGAAAVGDAVRVAPAAQGTLAPRIFRTLTRPPA
jgi:hypothetical protein